MKNGVAACLPLWVLGIDANRTNMLHCTVTAPSETHACLRTRASVLKILTVPTPCHCCSTVGRNSKTNVMSIHDTKQSHTINCISVAKLSMWHVHYYLSSLEVSGGIVVVN